MTWLTISRALLTVSLLSGSIQCLSDSQTQQPLFSNPPLDFTQGPIDDSDAYQFKWPIRRVAVIGAGPSGLIAYRELTGTGLAAHIFERDDAPGGNWHYTEEAPTDAPVPNAPIEVGDYAPSLPPCGVQLPYSEEYHSGDGEDEDARGWAERRRAHRGPKPLWATLHSNVPAPYQQITEFPWPKGTRWELPHHKLQKYMRAFASFHGLNTNDNNPDVSYNTRVELVEKRIDEEGRERGWRLTLKELVRTGKGSCRATWYTQDFDAIVVATGRYNAPNIPLIDGLTDWARQFPDRIMHSRQYRRPEPYANETILIVGAATSGGEISRDLNPHARKIYQSIKLDNASVPHYILQIFLRRLPANTTIVPEIKKFHPVTLGSSISSGSVELSNGTILTGIDRIIFATGFLYSFPFLPQYHNASIGLNESATGGAVQPIVTDGTHLRSLHLDLFYIEEPTIGFINMNLGIQPFTYAEYLSLALAKVWAGKATIPPARALWKLYDERVRDRGGYGRYFQFLGSDGDANIRYFMGWLNAAAVKYGGRQIDAIPEGNEDLLMIWAIARFGAEIWGRDLIGNTSVPVTAGFESLASFEEREGPPMAVQVRDLVFNDYW